MSIDPKTAGYVLGLLAAVLWLLSSFAWFVALLPKLDLGPEPTDGDAIGLRVSSEDDGRGTFLINGMNVPTFNRLAKYQRTIFWRNAVASGFSGLAALCACCAAYLAFMV